MDAQRVILGLDIGIGSVGWGLVQLTEKKYKDDQSGEENLRICGGKIIASGVRTFQLPQDEKGKSLAVKRGTARRSRMRIRRKRQRLKKLIALGQEFGLIDNHFTHERILKPHPGDQEQQWDIWWIRKEALSRKLTDTELFRILYHIAKHRGFYFHTKAEELGEANFDEDSSDPEKNEKGKIKKGLTRIRNKLKQGRWETVGQMFWEEFNQRQEQNKRKRNKEGDYHNSVHRLLLRDEIETIFDRQQKLFKNSKAQPALLKRYIEDILMHEEGHDDARLQKMMGRCELTRELCARTGRVCKPDCIACLCAPKESYTAERFSLFNRLNTLAFRDERRTNEMKPLNHDQRAKIAALAYNNAGGVTFAQIRRELGLHDDTHLRFNLCSYHEKNPEYKKITCSIKNGRFQFNKGHGVPIIETETGEIRILDEELKAIFRKKYKPNYSRITLYYSDIRKHLQNEEPFKNLNFRFLKLEKDYTQSADELGSQADYLKQFEEKELFIKLKGYHKIKKAVEQKCGNATWNQLSPDTATLDTIAEALTYHKSDQTRTVYLKERNITDEKVIDAVLTLNMQKLARYSKEALTNLLQYMDNGTGMLFHEAKEKCGYGKTIYKKQAILEPYGGFYEKNPVVARVFSQTRKVVNALVRKYGKTYPIDQIHIEVATELANSKQRKLSIAMGQKRYREEKEAAKIRCREKGLDPDEGQTLLMFRLAEQQLNRCPYTQTPISFEQTGSRGEVYIMDCEIDHVIPMSRSFNDSLNNKVLCTQKANQDKRDRIPFEWFEEQYGKDSQEWADFERWVKKLYGMPYSKRVNLTRKSWTDKDKEKFITRNLNDTRYAAREVADYLRKYFDFSKSKRDDIKEVSRIQLRSGGITAFLRHIWGLNKNREENDLHHAVDALVVACSTYGHVYLVSNLARQMERKGKNWFRHFDFLREQFKPWPSVREDIQNAVNHIFVSRMPRHTVTEAGHKETIYALDADTKENPKKRVISVNHGFAEMGPIVRADLYADKNGKNYVVPLYAVDFAANKPLPNRYICNTTYDKWPTTEEKGLTFKFSLFKDDLVEIDGIKYYIRHINSDGRIAVKKIDGSGFKEGEKDRISYKTVKLKKYSVDILGNYKEIKQEKRLGNKYEKTKNPHKKTSL